MIISERNLRIVVFLTMLPVVLWPVMITHVDHFDTALERFVLLMMPVFAVGCGFLARRVYRERPEVAWMLVGIVWLSYVSFTCLVYM